MSDPEPGDIVVYRREKTFPMKRVQEWVGVVEAVTDDHVDLGIDGCVSHDDIVEVKGKSPSSGPDSAFPL
jgi:hypothetical protein